MEFIRPVWISNEILGQHLTNSMDLLLVPSDPEYIFILACIEAEERYNLLIDSGWLSQQAREVLPNSLKTEIVVQANLREWRHIFKLRCDKAAHPQMSALMRPLLAEVQVKVPVVFDDIKW